MCQKGRQRIRLLPNLFVFIYMYLYVSYTWVLCLIADMEVQI